MGRDIPFPRYSTEGGECIEIIQKVSTFIMKQVVTKELPGKIMLRRLIILSLRRYERSNTVK